MEHTENQIILRGSLQGLPQFSHENHHRRFFRFILSVPRLSGTEDLLPVIVQEQILNSVDLSGGSMLRVEGQIRTHNIRENGVRRLLIFVFATSVTAEEGESINDVILQGPLCRNASYRHTPLGREICDVMLAVGRLPALYPVGAHSPAGSLLPYGRCAADHRKASKPRLHQADRAGSGRTDSL